MPEDVTADQHRPVPLGVTPIIDEPFSRVAVDLIGPIKPASEQGNQYILTVVDYATRYPEAVVLKKIDAESVADALLGIWTRIRIPLDPHRSRCAVHEWSDGGSIPTAVHHPSSYDSVPPTVQWPR